MSISSEVAAELARAAACRPEAGVSRSPARRQARGQRIAIGELAEGDPMPLSALLARRRSERVFTAPMLDDLACMLVSTHAVIEEAIGDDGYARTWRPTPSAGGRHPLDLVVAAADIDGLDAGVWWFDSWTSELVRDDSATEGPALDAVAKTVGSPPPAALFAVATPQRTLDRYPHGMSLVWRDVGVLLQTLHLLATERGLGSCIAGTTGVLMAGPEVIDLGALAVGARR